MATVANQDKNCWPRKMHRWTYLDVFGQICGAGRCSNSRRRAAKGRNNKWVHMFISLMWQCTLQPKKKIQRGAFFVPASDIFIDCARKFDLMRFIDAAKARWLPGVVFVCNGRATDFDAARSNEPIDRIAHRGTAGCFSRRPRRLRGRRKSVHHHLCHYQCKWSSIL